jgi:hypothetical protein
MMIGYRTIGAALFFAAGMAAVQPAAAQNVTAADPQSVAAVLRAEGLQVEVKTDKDGDPLLVSSIGENQKFSVYFYNCTNHANCETVQFYAGYSETKMNTAKLNDWNRTKRFGRAYIDQVGDPVVEMDIDLAAGGMSRALFKDNFEFWKTLMSQFSKFIYEE